LAAQNGVTVKGLNVSSGTVTFNVSWKNTGMPALWSDTVWVFVDYNNKGVMERLPLLPGATLTATSPGGKVIEEPDNNKGVWVAGNARTNSSFSATVKLLTAIMDVGGACMYGSNYPPVGEYLSSTEISFTGTPEYKVVLERSDKSTYTATVGKDESLSIPSGEVVLSFTDKTSAPGTFICIPSTAYNLVASAASYCTGSTVTFALSNTTSGRTYWLYKGTDPVNTLTGIGGAATFTGAFAGVGVYTAQVIAESGNCAAVMAGAHTVSENPVPTISHSGGNASQSINLGTAISAMTYTASNATSISRSGSTFPSGLNVAVSGSSYSIYGTPSAAGMFSYTVTTANNNGCTNATASGTITVVAVTPPDAASAKTWTYGGLTWSDAIRMPSGCNKSSIAISNTIPDCRSYTSNGNTWYYYNWTYVTQNATVLCPYPWRVPTESDLITLNSNTNLVVLTNTWGYGGYVSDASTIALPNGAAALWGGSTSLNRAWRISWDSSQKNLYETSLSAGFRLVCVK
jgi:hypothetical protein